jgi:GrpB-like predicted nucleotidyltransferase (UPF0157 family)
MNERGQHEEHEQLGLAYGKVRLVAAEPTWAATFAQIGAQLRAALGTRVVAIEHIGSTAVPGLLAKPILDVAVGLTSDFDAGEVITKISELGYIYRGDKGEEGGLLFVIEDRPLYRIAHIHVVPYNDYRWRRYLAFRDLLLNDPAKRDAYASMKHQLAEEFPDNRGAYTAGKAAFITRLLGRER